MEILLLFAFIYVRSSVEMTHHDHGEANDPSNERPTFPTELPSL